MISKVCINQYDLKVTIKMERLSEEILVNINLYVFFLGYIKLPVKLQTYIIVTPVT